jgi:hypothetical protein
MASTLGSIETLKYSFFEWAKHKMNGKIRADLLDKWSIKDGQLLTTEPTLTTSLNKVMTLINKINHTYQVEHLSLPHHRKIDPYDTKPDQVFLTVISEQHRDQYLDNCDKIKAIIKTQYQFLCGTYRGQIALKLLIDYIFQNFWARYYYRSYIWPFAGVVYGYSITSHRSQGSTYQNTFVNISNIMGCQKVSTAVKAKSLYTSITRASQTINILYHTSTLLHMMPPDHPLTCQLCHQIRPYQQFSPINYVIDQRCADHLLETVQSMTLYRLKCENASGSGSDVVVSDKHKNLYRIPCKALSELHINDAYAYLLEHGLLRTELERYQYSNLMLISHLIITDKHI